MSGLEIIECIAIKRIPNHIMLGVIFGTFSILIPMFVVERLTNDRTKSTVAVIISGAIYLVFSLTLILSGILEKPTGEYQYKVKITEDVGYVEFTDKYDVIAKNDDGTYNIQEKR